MNNPSGSLYDDAFLRHLPGRTGHPERPERLISLRDRIQGAPWVSSLVGIAPRKAIQQELALVHDPEFLALLEFEAKDFAELKELSTGDTTISHDSLEVARLAGGGVLSAVDAVM